MSGGDSRCHARSTRSNARLLLLGRFLGRLLGRLLGLLSSHGASPPFLCANVKVGKNRVNVFFIPRRVFFSARFEEKVHRRGAESAAEDRRLMMENGDPAPDRFVFDPASSILNAQFFS